MRKYLVTVWTAVLLAIPTIAPAVPADIDAALVNPDRTAEDREQDNARQPARLLNFLGLEQGDRVFDFVAAGGYYSELMARAVGSEGVVMPHNMPGLVEQFGMREGLDARGYGTRIPNAVPFEYEIDEVAFEPNSIDFALFNMVFHDFWFVPAGSETPLSSDPVAFLATLYTGMKPGGIVGIVDHVGLAGSDPAAETQRAHRIDPATIRAMMAEAGFVLDGEADFLRNPEDDHQLSVFAPEIRGQTDRVVYRFRKPHS
ncbi:putative methyltransferase [Parasphingopyxis lamellibrachiae]|uniref:Putative methyltransferase n=2 Tax=Parasphingopyxis lamellibrachiae TaxID=680125 RepID=A0A3D9FIX5_9SPHN|nr:putative methyltransferase [Parasphingopyxis lamellibrachiae]